MENKELEENAPVELEGNALDEVSGGIDLNQIVLNSPFSKDDEDYIKNETMIIIPVV